MRELWDLALRAAHAGGRSVTGPAGRSGAVEWKSSPTDPVTRADRDSDARIAALLSAERPEDGVLSEEAPERPSASGLRWVVDALDGSVNYLYGISHFAVSVAVEERRGRDWTPVVGVVHDPVRRETFSAARGAGAFRGGDRLRVSDPVPLPRALVATEFSYRADSRARQARAVSRILPAARDIRSTGSSALDLCWTAAGRFDGYYEDELERWDWAAGALIVREAGGVTSALGGGILAAGAAAHRELRALLETPAGAP
ncbi:inositol monophosphatase [Streptomyces sp. AJS327]|nr:inositol monophosphatase [Streptomyces sp. AJS327]